MSAIAYYFALKIGKLQAKLRKQSFPSRTLGVAPQRRAGSQRRPGQTQRAVGTPQSNGLEVHSGRLQKSGPNQKTARMHGKLAKTVGIQLRTAGMDEEKRGSPATLGRPT